MDIQAPSSEALGKVGMAPVQAIRNDDSICDTWATIHHRHHHRLSTLASSLNERTFTSSIRYL